MPKKVLPKPRGEAKSYMSGHEYRAVLDALGMSIRASAKFFRIDVKTSRRRALEQAPISFETAALLRLMLKLKIKPAAASVLVTKPAALTVIEKAN